MNEEFNDQTIYITHPLIQIPLLLLQIENIYVYSRRINT